MADRTATLPRALMPRALAWLTGTLLGRAVAVVLVVKLLVVGLRLAAGGGAFLDGLDVASSLALVAAAGVVAVRALGHLRRALLWRVRRKMLLSYVLVGAVPAFLLVAFFAISGLLLSFNVGAYMLRTQLARAVDRVEAEARATALEVARPAASESAAIIVARHQRELARTWPDASVALVDGRGRCSAAGATASPAVAAGPWREGGVPLAVPTWLSCDGLAGLVDGPVDVVHEGVALRAVSWIPGASRAVVINVPLRASLVRDVAEATGVSFISVSRFDDEPADPGQSGRRVPDPATLGAEPPGRIPLGTAQAPGAEPFGGGFGRSLRWVSFLDSVAWTSGERGVVFAELGVDLAGMYRRLTATPTPLRADFSLAQVLLALLGVLAGLFFVIQLVAYLMGFALARSITGAVHALFEGTEQVRRGDFSHKIAVASEDQLGELASSFNTMTGSIETLLVEKALKERMEQELKIARGIQMSLLPQDPLECGGISFAGYCEPARAVGGDYYDFWPIDEQRVGMLIADVAGKGTSAALYMAELKGIVLSLSQSHDSPRKLLIDANRIVSRHLDSRSFITMTYGVVDVAARTLTYARAGHCPLIRLPGPGAASQEPEIQTPDGLVLGLQVDDKGLFDRLLEEVTLPLGAGDVLVLYTDGVTEAMNPNGEFFGEVRLSALAQQHARRSFSDLRASVLQAITAFSGTAEQQDDITMLVLHVRETLPAAA